MISIKALHKSFTNKQVLQGIDLEIRTGETLAIIGRSGCGKSVLIKHIIGLLRPDSGGVFVDGKEVDKMNRKEIYDLRARFGYLFQGAALFDSMNVKENIALGLVENQMFEQDKIDEIVEEKLELVGLPGIGDLKPAELSGGMKKRVGLARALATNPEYLLYDEPTTGLDPVMSNQIDALIADLSDRLNVTSIVVTHDLFSVYTIAHRVAMIHEGQIAFSGTPEELQQSDNPAIVDFLERYVPAERARSAANG